MMELGILVYVIRRSPLALPETITTNGSRNSIRVREIHPDVPNAILEVTKYTYFDSAIGNDVLEKNVITFIPD